MRDIFTRHVWDLGTSNDRFDEFWKRFLHDLWSEMRNRHLIDSDPSFLGPEYDEYATWHDPVALHELATDCYIAAVLRRIGALRVLLQHSPSVAGAVRKNIKYFLIDRQRQANRTGYKLFKNVKKILQEAIEQSRLTVPGSDGGKLRKERVLQLDTKAGLDPIPRADLESLIDSSELWGHVVRVVTGPEDDARQPLLDALDELRASGVGALRLGDLLAALRERVQKADRSLGREAESGAGIIRTILADSRYEEDENRRERIEQIFAAIDRLERRDQVRVRIKRLFERLITLDEGQEEVEWERTYTELGISKSTFWEYINILRSIVKEIEDK